MAIGLSFVSGIIFPFMCNGHRADIRQVALSGNSWMANASSVVQDTKTNKPTSKSPKPKKKQNLPKPSGILRNARIAGNYEGGPAGKEGNAASRDWGIVPANLYAVNNIAERKAEKNASPDEPLTERIDKLGLGLFLKRGDVFFVFKRDRLLYQATAFFTKATSHPDLPADLKFGHAGVITHFVKGCAENDVWHQFTECVYVTEQGRKGLEFRTLHEALSGQSEVLILRPTYATDMANQLADAAMKRLDIGANYDTLGAVGATLASVGKREDPNASQPQEKIFCSQLVMMLLAEAKVLRGNVEMCLPPSSLADMLLKDIPLEQRELWGKEGQLGAFRGVAPSEVVFYQQCAENAEGKQFEATVTYPSGWNRNNKLGKKKNNNNKKKKLGPWREETRWVDSPVAVPGVMGLLTRWIRSGRAEPGAKELLGQRPRRKSSQAKSVATSMKKKRKKSSERRSSVVF